MRNYKTTGIIIKTIKLGDADKLIVLFSKEKGKIYLKARGVRKIKSKLGGHLGIISIVNLDVVKGKGDIDVITSAVSVEIFENIKNDLKKISLAYFFAEVIDKLLRNDQENKEIYTLFRDSLEILDKLEEERIYFLKTIFLYKMIKILGHAPILNSCLECQLKISDRDKVTFDFENGGVVCPDCDSSHNYREVTVSLLKSLNAMDKIDIKNAINLKIEKTELKNIESLLADFKKYIFDKNEYKSENLLNKVFG